MPDRLDANAASLAWMERIRAKDAAALRKLYDAHAGVLLAIGLRLLRDRGDAEQLLIDVFAEIWQHPDRYNPDRSNPLSYLILLTRSRGLDRLRSRRDVPGRLPAEPQQSADAAMNPLTQAVDREQNTLIHNALAHLTDDERTAVELSFMDGLSHSEIATRLCKPLGTIKTQIRQGIIHLRVALRNVLKGDQDSL